MSLTSPPSPEMYLKSRGRVDAARADVTFRFHTDFLMNAAPDADWLDTMVSRLIKELEEQLKAVSSASKHASTPQSRAADARTLAALERTLERLSKLERERAAVRERKVAKHGAEARAALERRLDQRLAAIRKKGAAAKPKP